MSSEAVFVTGKRKYVFCADQHGMQFLFGIFERVKEDELPLESFLFEEKRDWQQLYHYLKQQKMGTYLYVSLPQTELQQAKGVIEEVGFSEEEVQFIGYGKKAVRIFCCRCHQMNETNEGLAEILCSKCGLELSVSDHYSVFHHAFLGYVSKL
jgi:dimethylamine monooxygenase subunit C